MGQFREHRPQLHALRDLHKRWIEDGGATERPARTPKRTFQRQTRLSEPEIQQLISRYQDGELLRDLATDFHITRQTASILLKRHGIKTRYNLLSDVQLPEIQSAYEAGDSLATLGDRYNVDKSTIHNFLKKHGVQLRKRLGWESDGC